MVFENGACGSLITPQSPGKNSAAAAKWFRVLGGGNLAITPVLVGEENTGGVERILLQPW